nr:MAG TPA: hypothetical protein [Caudoviricetes sp.]
MSSISRCFFPWLACSRWRSSSRLRISSIAVLESHIPFSILESLSRILSRSSLRFVLWSFLT